MDDYEDHLFIVLKVFYCHPKEKKVQTRQLSLVLGSNFVISFLEKGGDIFGLVRKGISIKNSPYRKMDTDYLVYAMIDEVVGNYFLVLERLGGRIENIEGKLITDPSPQNLQAIQNLKRNLLILRKSVWPLREIIARLERGDSLLIREKTKIYFRDVYDHTIKIIDTIETYRDILAGVMDIYLSAINYRLNEVMKFLTIIATIFIPLTFITGLYGMNFKYMPELDWHGGYPAVLFVILATGILMVIYFKKKKWF